MSENFSRINFISNLDPNNFSGGWNGINYQLQKHLRNHFLLEYCGPIEVPVIKKEKFYSVLKRKLGGKGGFYFFSEKRLERIAESAGEWRNTMATADFFFGQTSWVKCETPRKYFVYMDIAFPDYLEIYIGKSTFVGRDIQRIFELERLFLENATGVFISSRWASENAVTKLGLKHSNNHFITRVAGNIPMPDRDHYDPKEQGLSLLFISLKFEEKGGWACFEAFRFLKQRFPGISLHIIGELPPETVVKEQGVHYHGRLNKGKPEDLKKFVDVLELASFLVHPTRMDATPTVISEAGYFGCPAIAPNCFGIPDLIVDGETGFLLRSDDYNREIEAIVSKVYSDSEKYLEIRKKCRAFALTHLSWDGIARQIAATIKELI